MLVHRLNGSDTLCTEAAPLEPFEIHGARACRLPLTHDKRRLIGKQQTTHGGHAMGANSYELVYNRKPTQNHPIAHMYMTGKLRVVGKDGVAPDLAVVCQVHIGHDPIVITQSGDTQVTRGADIEGTKFSNGIARTDYQLTGLTLVFLILRNRTQ